MQPTAQAVGEKWGRDAAPKGRKNYDTDSEGRPSFVTDS